MTQSNETDLIAQIEGLVVPPGQLALWARARLLMERWSSVRRPRQLKLADWG